MHLRTDLPTLLSLATAALLLATCGGKGPFEPCSKDSECSSGCCQWEDRECDTASPEENAANGLVDYCMAGHSQEICCSYEYQDTYTDNLGNSHTYDWTKSCTCGHQSCSEVTASSECSGGSCTSTQVRNVSAVDDCS